MDIQKSEETKEKDISGRKYSTCESMDQLCKTHMKIIQQHPK